MQAKERDFLIRGLLDNVLFYNPWRRQACFGQLNLNSDHCYTQNIRNPLLCATCCDQPGCNFIKPIEQQIAEAEQRILEDPGSADTEEVECVFKLKFNLNMFFSIFDSNDDNMVDTTEILKFGKDRNMIGMLNLAGILLGKGGIKDYSSMRGNALQEMV